MKLLAVPPRRLIDVVKRTIDGYNVDDIPALAAGVTYFAFFSIFPFLLLVVALAGIFMDPAVAIEYVIQSARNVAPSEDIIVDLTKILNDIIDDQDPANPIAAVIGFVGLLFGASGVFGIIDKAINRAWGCEFAPSLIRDRLISFAMVAGLLIALIASLTLAALINLAQTTAEPVMGIVPGNKWIWYTINLISSLALYTGVLTIVYRTLPRCKVSWQEVWPGALLAAVLWELLKQGFALYLGNFANYDAVYGTLGTVVALLTWIWLSSQVLLLGAEFSSQYAREYERLEVVRAAAEKRQSVAGRLRADRLQRRRRHRLEDERERRRAQTATGRPRAAYAPPARSARVIAAAALGAAIAGIIGRLAMLLLRR